MNNDPYSRIDIDRIPIEECVSAGARRLFKISTSAVKSFDACIFRKYLIDFLFNHMDDAYSTGNDKHFGSHNMYLELSDRDAKKFIAYGWIL